MSQLHSRLRPLIKFSIAFGGSAAAVFVLRRQLDSENEISLGPRSFAPFKLTAKHPTSSTAAILVLRHEGSDVLEAKSLVEEARGRGVWSVQIKQPQLQIARSYTPLPDDTIEAKGGAPEEERMNLDFLVRREHGGEVSNYLHGLPIGTTVEIRGPFIEYTLPTSTRRILFLAGGTGIAPAAQIAASLQARPKTEMSILWASRKEEDCLGGAHDEQPSGNTLWSQWRSLMPKGSGATSSTEKLDEPNLVVQLLRKLETRSPGRVRVDYFIDEHQRYITTADVKASLERLASGGLRKGTEGDGIILVSGPPGFVQYWAGAKVWDAEGESQGPLSGALSKMRLDGWQVWKL